MSEKNTTNIKAFAIDPDDLVIIGGKQCPKNVVGALDTDDGDEHPLYDKRVKLPVDVNMAKDMLMNGFRGSIEVRANGSRWEVVFGRQRVKAARLAKQMAEEQGKEAPFVKCIPQSGSDAELFGVMIGENVHRRGFGVLETADKLSRYINLGRSEEEAAVTFGMSKQNVKNLLKYGKLTGNVRKAVEKEEISPSAAAELADLSREEQEDELKVLLNNAMKGVKPTKAAAKKSVKKRKGGDERTPPPKRLMLGVLKLYERAEESDVPADFVKGVKWALGIIGSGSIGGLRDLEKQFEDLKAKKKGGKAEEE